MEICAIVNGQRVCAPSRGDRDRKKVSLIGDEYTDCKKFGKDCIEHIYKIITSREPNLKKCFDTHKNWVQDLLDCACVKGNKGANPLILLALAFCETLWGTDGQGESQIIRCHNPFGTHFREVRNITSLCPKDPRNPKGYRLPTFKESACETARRILRDGGIKYGVYNSGDCVKEKYEKWKKECERLVRKL